MMKKDVLSDECAEIKSSNLIYLINNKPILIDIQVAQEMQNASFKNA